MTKGRGTNKNKQYFKWSDNKEGGGGGGGRRKGSQDYINYEEPFNIGRLDFCQLKKDKRITQEIIKGVALLVADPTPSFQPLCCLTQQSIVFFFCFLLITMVLEEIQIRDNFFMLRSSPVLYRTITVRFSIRYCHIKVSYFCIHDK